MNLLLGILVGLLLPPAWRLVRSLREARRGDYLDVRSKERVEMMVKDNSL